MAEISANRMAEISANRMTENGMAEITEKNNRDLADLDRINPNRVDPSRIRFSKRFILDTYQSIYPEKLKGDLDLGKEVEVLKIPSSNLWITRSLEIVFPYETNDPKVYGISKWTPAILFDPEPLSTEEVDSIEFYMRSHMDPLYLSKVIYQSGDQSGYGDIPSGGNWMWKCREALIGSKYRDKLEQKFASYELPELAPLQRDYITEFFQTIWHHAREEQDDALENLNLGKAFFANFNPRRDTYPLPLHPMLNAHVNLMILDLSATRNWRVIFGYEIHSRLENKRSYGGHELPPLFELEIHVSLDEDDQFEEGEEDITSINDEGERVVIYAVTLSLAE